MSRNRPRRLRPVLFLCLLFTAGTIPAVEQRPWTDEVIYFALTDRFLDGDAENNVPPGSPAELHDPARKNINLYHGGDLRGLEQAIQSGYFTRLGVTALWITPPVKNVWLNARDFGGMKTGYHGYWAQDFLDIDPHLISRKSLDGKSEYPDTRDGRMAHYRDFVALAKSRGIRIVQDVVLNHAGPVFHYDANQNGAFDHSEDSEWIQPFRMNQAHPNARWANIPAWNLRAAQPSGPVNIFGKTLALNGAPGRIESFSRRGFNSDSLGKSDDEGIWCDFTSLRDYDTSPGSPHFNALVDDFVEIYRFYIEDIGVGALRVDTVKHVHHEFWDAFTSRLRAKLGAQHAKNVLLFGEVYDGNPAVLGRYTWRADAPSNPAPSLDSVLDFQFCFAIRSFLRQPGGNPGQARAVEDALKSRLAGTDTQGRPFYNPHPGPDGRNAIQKSISFVENHDGLNRFRVKDITETKHLLAQAILLTSPGIPCLYYGAESARQDPLGVVGQDGESGRFTLFSPGQSPAPAEVEKSRAFQSVAGLTALRAKFPALREGEWQSLWADSGNSSDDDGTLVYARVLKGVPRSAVVVAINAGARTAKIPSLRLPGGVESWKPLPLPCFASPAAPVKTGAAWSLPSLPAGSVGIFVPEGSEE